MIGRRSSVGPRSASTAFSFPILSTPETVECLGEMGACTFTEKDIEKPKKEVVETVFESLLCHCQGMTLEEISQPHVTVLGADVEYPGLFEDSIPRSTFLRSCQDLLADCGCTDFGIVDFSKPDRKRLIRQLSAIINYAKYREERIQVFHEAFEQRDARKAVLTKRMDEIEELKAAIADAQESYELEKPEIDAEKQLTDELQTELREANDRQALLRGETAEIKKDYNKAKDELAAKEVELTEERNKAEALETQIVHSPERIKQEHVHMAKQKLEEEELCQEVEAQRREMKNRVAEVAKLKKKVATLMEQLARCKSVYAKRKTEKSQFKVLQERLDGHHDAASEMRAQKKCLEKAIQRASEKLSELRAAAHGKTSSTTRSLHAAREEHDVLSKENDELRAARDTALSKKKALEKRREDARSKHAAAMEDMVSSFHALRSKVNGYHSKVLSAMNGSHAE